MKKYTLLLCTITGLFTASICRAQTFGIIRNYMGGHITYFAGNGDGYSADSAVMQATGMCTDLKGNMYISDEYARCIRKVDGITHIISSLPGTATDENEVCVDDPGNVYFTKKGSGGGEIIMKINLPAGTISTIAGNGTIGYSGNGGPATNAQFKSISSIYVDHSGNLYCVDSNRVRKINGATGIIDAFAGSVTTGFSGDGGPATNATFNSPYGITGDNNGNIYVSDCFNNRIRKIDAFGIITTLAGDGTQGYSGDGGFAINAQMNRPRGIANDLCGNIFFIDQGGSIIRRVNTITGVIYTAAGANCFGCGFITRASSLYETGVRSDSVALGTPTDLCVNSHGNLFYSLPYINKVRIVTGLETSSISDSFVVIKQSICNGIELKIITNHYTSGQRVVTDYGDGFSDTVSITGSIGHGVASRNHTYLTTGNYMIKQVLYNGTLAIDSVILSHYYTFCRSLPIKLYNDQDGDCNKGTLESYNYGPVLIKVDRGGIPVDTFSNTSGLYYNAYGVIGDVYSFSVLPGTLYGSCPIPAIVYDTIQSGIAADKYLGLSCSSVPGYDLAVQSSVRCGKHASEMHIILNNLNCTSVNTTLTVHFSPKYTYASSTVSPSSITSNTLTWSFNNLSTANVPLKIKVLFNGFSLPMGDTIHSQFSITPTSGDVNTANNMIIRVDTVKAGYDPNFIEVTPDGCFLTDTQFQYTIHFENTGNDTAHNIYVLDTLSDYLDINSLRILAATAEMDISVFDKGQHNIVKFDFPNIKLLDSSHHGSNDGAVVFNIRTKAGVPYGAIIANRAGIYFDENPVVMTNTVYNTMGCHPAAMAEVAKNTHDAELYPNPTTNELTIKTEQNAFTTYTITNSVGQVLMQQPLGGVRTTVNVSPLPPGLYYVVLKGNDGSKAMKFVKM